MLSRSCRLTVVLPLWFDYTEARSRRSVASDRRLANARCGAANSAPSHCLLPRQLHEHTCRNSTYMSTWGSKIIANVMLWKAFSIKHSVHTVKDFTPAAWRLILNRGPSIPCGSNIITFSGSYVIIALQGYVRGCKRSLFLCHAYITSYAGDRHRHSKNDSRLIRLPHFQPIYRATH